MFKITGEAVLAAALTTAFLLLLGMIFKNLMLSVVCVITLAYIAYKVFDYIVEQNQELKAKLRQLTKE